LEILVYVSHLSNPKLPSIDRTKVVILTQLSLEPIYNV